MMTLGGCPPRFLTGVERLTVTRAGEYFFMPGIAALGYIARA